MKTTELNKPREFWIEIWKEQPADSDLIIQRPVATRKFEKCIVGDELIHVIEKSAYDELQKKLEIALYALKEASEYNNTDDVNGEAGYICWKALKQIEDKNEND